LSSTLDRHTGHLGLGCVHVWNGSL